MSDKAVRALQRRLADAVDLAQVDFADAVRRLALALAVPQHRRDAEAARQRLAEVVVRVLAAGDLAARVEMRFGAVAAAPEKFATHQIVGTPLSFEVPALGDLVPDVEFEAAVRDFRERDAYGALELEAMGLSVADVYGGTPGPGGTVIYPHAFAALRAANQDVAERVRELLATTLGTPTPRVAQALIRRWDWPADYACTVVRTNYSTAMTAGRFREAVRIEQATGVRMGFRYSAVRDSDVRRGRPQDKGENHLALDGVTARHDDPVWMRWSPPGGFNCFPGETLVQGDVLLVTRMYYAGETIEILTKRGHRLTLTPKHEVVTTEGMCPAFDLKPGQYLLDYRWPQDRAPVRSFPDIHKEHEPLRVEQMFRALAERNGIFRLDTSTDDFDGDAVFGNGKVDVVTVDRELANYFHSRRFESIAKPVLIAVAGNPTSNSAKKERAGSCDDRFIGSSDASAGIVSSSALARHDLGVIFPRFELRPLESLRFGSASRLDTVRKKSFADGSSRDSEFICQLLLRGSSVVAPDQVVSIKRDSFAAHVYDLQTKTGWIVANDIFISNCRCYLEVVMGDEVPTQFVRVPQAAAFADGFGTRADLRAYG